MIVARTITEQLENASWIRRMFEEGARMKAERGAENVFDFTLGNPEVEPPAPVLAALRKYAERGPAHMHGYMPNAGFPQVREVIAERMRRSTGLPYTANHILMTVGSSGAINTALKAMLDPGDEVIVLRPYFPEYRFYIANHAGCRVEVDTDERFRPDPERIARALTPRTKALILNSPHNPSGVLYTEAELAAIERAIAGTGVVVITDEPYRTLVFDGRVAPETPRFITRALTAMSWSKAQAISGERIGYLAISPNIAEAEALNSACTFTNRILGYINAPAIWQFVEAEAGEAAVDPALYQAKRDAMWNALTAIGYECLKPEGSFYIFPKTPVADDIAFIRRLLKEGVLAVPGSGFGRGGYFRISLTVPMDVIERSIPAFARAFVG